MTWSSQVRGAALLALGLILGATTYAHAKTIQLGSATPESVVVSHVCDYYTDPTNSALLADVTKLAATGLFVPSDGRNSFGFTQDSIWARCQLENLEAKPFHGVIDVSHSTISELVYFEEEGHTAPPRTVSTGLSKPFSTRDIPATSFAFRFHLNGHQHKTLYFKARSVDSILLSIKVYKSEAAFNAMHNQQSSVYGLYFGVIIAIVLINLFHAVKLWNRSYLYYCVTIVLIHLCTMAGVCGVAHKYIVYNNAWLAERQIIFSLALGLAVLCFFTQQFMDTKRYAPRGHVALGVVAGASTFSALVPLFTMSHLVGVLLNGVFAAVVLTIVPIGFIAYRKKHINARYFLGSWTALIVFTLMYMLRDVGMVPDNFVTRHSIYFGGALEALILAFALSNQLKVVQDEKHKMDKNIELLAQGLLGKISVKKIGDIVKNPSLLKLEPTEQRVTIMFVDIVNYSVTAETSNPAETFESLRKLLNRIIDTIHYFDGIVNKTLGDGLVCYFGYNFTGETSDDHEEDALKAAIAVQKMSVNKLQGEVPKIVFPLRIGINTAVVQLGNIGSENRLDFTLIGEGVNFAQRLESSCDPFKIMLSKSTFDKLPATMSANESVRKIEILIKHASNLAEAYEYNVFHTDRAKLIQAERSLWHYFNFEKAEERHETGDQGIKVQTQYGEYTLLDISQSGLCIVGQRYLARGVQLAIRIRSASSDLEGELSRLDLSPFFAEIRWSRYSTQGYKHGLSITNLNTKLKKRLLTTILELGAVSSSTDKAAS